MQGLSVMEKKSLEKIMQSIEHCHQFTRNGILQRPINSLSCLPVDAVTAISFMSFLNPLTPLTSKNFVIFSLTVSAGSKSLCVMNCF